MADPPQPPQAQQQPNVVPNPIQSFSAQPPERINIRNQNEKARIWKDWIQQYEWFELAAGIKQLPEERQVGILMNSLGPDVLGTFMGFQLTDEEKKDPAVIKQKFGEAFNPTANPTYSTYIFLKTDQGPDESFDSFLIKLRQAIVDCDFNTPQEGMSTEDRLLKDKIVLGIRSQKVREKLLSDSKLTLDKAIQICRSSEKTTETLNQIVTEAKMCDAIQGRENNKPFYCRRCGTKHGRKSCPAFKKTCPVCNITGHLAECCFRKSKDRDSVGNNSRSKEKKTASIAQATVESSDEEEVDLHLHAIRAQDNSDTDDDWFEEVLVGSTRITFKLDCGAQCNVVPLELARKAGAELLHSSTKYIVSYNGHRNRVEGEFTMKSIVKGREGNITYKVVDLDVIPVLGRASCVKLNLLKRVDAVKEDNNIFKGLGCLKGFQYELDLKPDAKFEIRPARVIPHKIREAVKEELENMVKLGVIRKQEEPTPVVSNLVVVRKNNKIRLCIDPTDVNRNILRRHYPLRTIEEIAARIQGSTWFTILDCKKGFWQIQVAEASQKYLTFGTPWGRYSCKRLPFGLASAPEVFQNQIATLLDGIPNTEVSMDDILIYAESKEELEEITAIVINRLESAGLKLNKEKCKFAVRSAKYLGHIVSAEGLKPDSEKIAAIQRLKVPDNKKQLQRLLAPLRLLLQKEVAWVWSHEQQAAFEDLKSQLSCLPTLKFYDVNQENVLSVDCSSHSMGAVLMQEGRPVAYASKALTPSQQNYPQIEKEAFAIRFGCQKFHPYIFGRPVTIETDHKPLESIFKKPLDKAPPRLKRIILDVQPYAPSIVYVKGENVPIADTLSRDVSNPKEICENELEVHVVLNVTKPWMEQIVAETEKSEALQKLMRCIVEGWPEEISQLDSDVRSYWNFRDELSSYEGVIFKGDCILVPEALRNKVLSLTHAGHFGIQSCIRRAKQLVFWPGMGQDIQQYVDECSTCQKHSRNCVKEPMIVKKVPEYPFQIVASDIFHFNGVNYLVLIDSYSGWIDFKKLRTMESSEVIGNLEVWFAVWGVPEEFNSDNAKQYTSQLFKQFASTWGFVHVTSSPYYPQSNGLSERAVQIAKNILRKCKEDGSSVQLGLLNYRNIPRSKELLSPNQRMISRITKTPLPIVEEKLKPAVVENVKESLEAERQKQKDYYDRGARKRPELEVNEDVLVQNTLTNTWESGKVIAKTNAPRSIIVEKNNGDIVRRNMKHVRRSVVSITPKPEVVPEDHPESDGGSDSGSQPSETGRSDSSRQPPEARPSSSSTVSLTDRDPDLSEIQPNNDRGLQPYVTRAGRTIKPIVRLDL